MKPRIPLNILYLSLLTGGPALADGGTLRFEGLVYEPGCSMTVVAATPNGQTDMPITADLNLQVATHNDACSHGYTAFTADYAALPGSDSEADDQVITLTYN